MKTVPDPCPTCKGSRSVIALLEKPEFPFPDWQIYSEVGFLQIRCYTCSARGCMNPEPAPSMDPNEWPHRVPENVRAALKACRLPGDLQPKPETYPVGREAEKPV